MPDIAVWNMCNNHCLMCSNPFDFQLEVNNAKYSFEDIKQRWSNRKILPSDSLCLTGGEPTSHPDFFRLVSWFHHQYPDNQIVIASNGRMFSYLGFTKNLLKINNLLVEIAIHGNDDKTHDFVTRTKGSFKQTIEGIHNILRNKKESQSLEIRIIISKLTYKNLDKILDFINREFDVKKIRDVVLIFIEMEGQAEDNKNITGVTYKEVMKFLPQTVEKWVSHFNDLRLYHFPLCVLPPKLWKYAHRTLRGEEIVFIPRCKKCLYKKYCLGIHYDYIPLFGDKEFTPPPKMKIETSEIYQHPISKVIE